MKFNYIKNLLIMKKYIFLIEVVVGILGIILVLFLGVKGIAILALYAITPFLKEKKEETIESKLVFHKTNSITFVVGILLLFLLFFIQDYKLITNTSLYVKDIWFYVFITFSIFIHGLIGLILLKKFKK
ncbi:MAG: hypothetical protein WDA77_13495 [Acidimicrobiia bacterium]